MDCSSDVCSSDRVVRYRVPSRSMTFPLVERLHSVTAAEKAFALGNSDRPCKSLNRSISSLFQKSCSNLSAAFLVRDNLRAKLRMIAQVQMLASSSPSMTTFTTISACMNRASGEIVAASVIRDMDGSDALINGYLPLSGGV